MFFLQRVKKLLLGFTILLASFCIGFNTLGQHAAATIILEQNGPPPDEFLESKGSFVPPSLRQTAPEFLNFMAQIGPVIVFSDNIKNNSNVIDFDEVPATTPPNFMRFNTPYQVQYYVYNRGNNDISIDSIRLSEVVSNETRSPFEFCGMNYNNTSIHLPPGNTQALSICFYPEMTGPASATLQFYQGSQVLFNLPVRGNGVNPEGMPQLGFMEESGNQTDVENISLAEDATISNHISKIPLVPSNLSSDTQSFLIEPLTDCSVTIEGGGQRPNPAVSGWDINNTRIGPSNTTPVSPLDDGLDLNDNTTRHHKINVGQLVKLEANVSGLPPQSIKNISWTISEPKIKDYNATIPGKFVTYNLTTQDYLQPAVSFYWKDDGGKKVTVTVEEVSNNQSKKCSTSRIFNVERNHDDIDRQASDFYVFNHNATLLEKHFGWHWDHQLPRNVSCDPSYNGEEFLRFHKGVISNFDSWRETFGYPEIIAWDPANDPPKNIDLYNVDDQYRTSKYQPQPIPSYYTTQGGNTNSHCALAYNQTIFKLSDYKDADYLGSEIEETWHNDVHGAIGSDGGDMNDPGLAPRDPVFWMWHKYLDSIYDTYTEIKGQK